MTPQQLIARWRELAQTLDRQAQGFRKDKNTLAALIYTDTARIYADCADQLEAVLHPTPAIVRDRSA